MSAVGDARKRHAEAQQNRALVEAIAATLAEHEDSSLTAAQSVAHPGNTVWWEVCTCGERREGRDDNWHRVHVATILAEQEAQRTAAAVDRERQWHGHAARGGGL